MRSLLIAFFACILFSCNSSNSGEKNKTDSLSTVKSDTSKNVNADTASAIYCYITGIEKMHDSVWLKVDYVDYYHGPNVLEDAKRLGHADTAFDNNKKVKDIFVVNDYFIVNDDQSLRTLYLPANAPITMDTEIAQTQSKEINSYAYFSKHYENSLFLLKLKKNIVESISEVFLP